MYNHNAYIYLKTKIKDLKTKMNKTTEKNLKKLGVHVSYCRKCCRDEPYFYTDAHIDVGWCGMDICHACVMVRELMDKFMARGMF